MNEIEFKIALHSRLCDMADLILHYYNPCDIRKGACRKADPNPCCVMTRFKRFDDDRRCQFLGEGGCEFPNIECKVWLCEIATGAASQECLSALVMVENIAKAYRLTNES